jgi:hypothetical protein
MAHKYGASHICTVIDQAQQHADENSCTVWIARYPSSGIGNGRMCYTIYPPGSASATAIGLQYLPDSMIVPHHSTSNYVKVQPERYAGTPASKLIKPEDQALGDGWYGKYRVRAEVKGVCDGVVKELNEPAKPVQKSCAICRHWPTRWCDYPCNQCTRGARSVKAISSDRYEAL